MNAIKMMLVVSVLWPALVVRAAPALNITDVTCRQRYPWNGKVDIDYTLACEDASQDVYILVHGEDRATGQRMNVRTLSGEGAAGPVRAGRHRLVWDAQADVGGILSTNAVIHIQPFLGAAPYLVVDLTQSASSGKRVYRYSAVPPDLDGATCRTTEMWFRLILPGTFAMGSRSWEPGYAENRERLRQVTLTDAFYISVFETTRAQWEYATGTNILNTSYASHPEFPFGLACYNEIRGTELGAQWPKNALVDAGSFLGRFRAKTGLMADLPTSAQWEYACRAGTETMLNNGTDPVVTNACAELNEVSRNYDNQVDGKGGSYAGATKVGCYRPNAWGLYDMHGNAAEWCRDYTGPVSAWEGVDPVGGNGASVNHRVYRGGSVWGRLGSLRSARWESIPPDGYYSGATSKYTIGFRLVLILAATAE